MSDELASGIIEKTNFQELIQMLISLIGQTLNLPVYDNQDSYLIDYALELWTGCLLHKNELIETVYNATAMSVEEFTIRGLTFPRTVLVRFAFGGALKSIC